MANLRLGRRLALPLERAARLAEKRGFRYLLLQLLTVALRLMLQVLNRSQRLEPAVVSLDHPRLDPLAVPGAQWRATGPLRLPGFPSQRRAARGSRVVGSHNLRFPLLPSD